jgi:outer membrane receptor for ferrienterochelin and colicins
VKSRPAWIALLLAGATPTWAREITAEIELGSVEDVEVLVLEDLLEQPVTAASGYASKPSDSPTLVSTMQGDAIRGFGYRTVRDALQGMRGVYVGNDRNYSYIGARGYGIPGDYNTRFALSIDNHPINDGVYGQASLGGELGLPMIAVERIELVRGGAWSVHGENALLGAVQVVTASGATRPGVHVTSTTRATAQTSVDPSNRPGFESRGEDVAASYGAVKDGKDIFVAGQYTYDPGLSAIHMPELATTDEPCVDLRGRLKPCDGVVHGSDGEEIGSLYASLRTKHIEAHVMTSRRRKEVPTASFGSLVGSPMETFDDRAYVDVVAKHSTPSFDLVGQLAADYWNYTGTYPFADYEMAADGIGLVMNHDGSSAKTVLGELRGRYKWAELGNHVRDAEIAMGFAGRAASTAQYGLYAYPEGDEYYLDRKDPSRIGSIFGHAGARLFDHVVGFAAVRGDYHADAFGVVVNPQAGLVIDGGEVGRFRASISRGYRPPTLYEQFYSTASGLPPADLEPERSVTGEVSIERYLGEHMRVLVVGFGQNVTNLIGVTMNDDQTVTGVFANHGGAHSYGVETELEGRWKHLQLNATYSFTHARNNDESLLANSPTSLASLRLLAPLAKARVLVGIESFYVSKRTSYNGTMIDPLFTTNAAVTMPDITKSLDLTLGVSNLFDERGGDPSSEEHRQSSIPHDPRTVWLRLSVGLAP